MESMTILPNEAPAMAPLQLVTMTLISHSRDESGGSLNFNLDVIYRHTQLDTQVSRIGYRNNTREHGVEMALPTNYDAYATSGRFKNQCSFVINVGDKNINTKLFNNGKMVNVGCLKVDHCSIAAKLILDKIQNMTGLLIYKIPATFPDRNIKKFFKDEIRKKYGQLVTRLCKSLNLDLDLSSLNEELRAEDSFKLFAAHLRVNDHCERDIMYIYTVIQILKSYFGDEKAMMANYNTKDFQDMLQLVSEHSDREAMEISCEFPAYVRVYRKLQPASMGPSIALINKSTSCGYYLNRSRLQALLKGDPYIVETPQLDKLRYPGVVARYQASDKIVKIVFFNTGKINITAANTHKQVDEAYAFITKYCRDHYSELVLQCEYDTDAPGDQLPAQHYVGISEGRQYYLLKKQSIITNPRNVRFLKTHGLLPHYRIAI